MEENNKMDFIGVMHIRFNGKNARVQRDEIQAIFDAAKEKAEDMSIDADLTFFDR